MKKIFIPAIYLILFTVFPALAKTTAQKDSVPPRIIAYVEKASAVYKVGEKIRFKVWFVQPKSKSFTDLPLKDCKIIAGEKLDYVITGDGGLSQTGSVITGDKEVIIETALPRPGFVLLTLTKGTGKDQIIRHAGAGVEPEKIKSGTVMPADFEAYWQSEIAKMRSRKADIKVREATEYINDFNKNLVKIYDVTISDGKLTASGILTIPRHPGKEKLPVVVGFGGASWIGATPNVNEAVYRNVIHFAMNIHGTKNFVPTNEEKYAIRKLPEIRNYHKGDLHDRDKFAIRNVYLRVIRTLDYLKTRPEWNKKDLIVSGPSFGGCQTIVAAALCKEVTLALAGGPACCDHHGAVNNQTPGYPNLLAYYNDKKFSDEIRKKAYANAPYFDAANMARLVKAPIVFSVGFIDTTCPPTSVYSAYNNIPGKNKSMFHSIYAAHGASLVSGDGNAFSACNATEYRELVCGNELLVNGHFRYQVPGKDKTLVPYVWLFNGKDAKVKNEGDASFISIKNGTEVFQFVYNLRKAAGTVTVKGKFRGKGESTFALLGAVKPSQRSLKPVSAEKWQDFTFTFNVRKGTYGYRVILTAGKNALLEMTDLSVTLDKQ